MANPGYLPLCFPGGGETQPVLRRHVKLVSSSLQAQPAAAYYSLRGGSLMRRPFFPWILLFHLGLTLSTAGAQQTPKAREEAPAPQPSAPVQQLLNETRGAYLADQFETALKTLDQAFITAIEAKDRVGAARVQRGRALTLERLDRLSEALAAWREAARLWEQVADGPGRVEALGRAGALLAADQPAEAQALLTEALTLGRREAIRPRAAATALASVARGSYGRWQLSQAREFATTALKIQEKLAPHSLEMADTLDYLGAVTGQQGDLPAARNFFRRSLVIREKLAPRSLDLAGTLGNLGLIARQQGDLAAAREYHQRALALLQKLVPGSLALANSLNNLGTVTTEQGDLAAGRNYFQRALGIQEQLSPGSAGLASSLGNLGNVAYRQGDLGAARDYLQRAHRIHERLAPGSLDVARCLDGLGAVALAQEDVSGSREFYRQALAIQERLAPGSLDMANTLNALGLIVRRQGEVAAAREYLRQALAIRKRLAPHSFEVARSLSDLADLAHDQGDLTEAEERAGEAWHIVRAQAPAVTGEEARQAFGAATADHAAELVRYQVARKRVSEAFATVEEGRAQALQQLLLERQADLRVVEPRLWSAYRSAVMARERTEQILSKAGLQETLARRALETARATPLPPADQERLQVAWEAAAAQLETAQSAYIQARLAADLAWAAVKKSAPRAFPQPLGHEQALRLIQPGVLFVAFSVGEKETHLIQLQRRVQSFTTAVTARDLKVATAGRELFAQLFPAEAGAAVLAAKRLLISPDGPLWDLPFAVLVTSRAGPVRYLGLEKPLTYTPSLTVWGQFHSGKRRPAGAGKPTALVVGDPLFEGRPPAAAVGSNPLKRSTSAGERSFLFPDGQPPLPLPWTRKEASALSALYGSRPLLGAAATEAAVRQQMGPVDVVHLATHGFLHPYRGMSSGVLLAAPQSPSGPSESTRDGALLAWEIRDQLRLKAELVVLSACETGRGETVHGEGIIGLTRAVQLAGARSIVASHWKVRDTSTATLMVAFHRRLRAGLAKDEALRQAMRVLRANPESSHPYYWASFFLTGDPDNPNLGVRSARK
jgi:CHAT domain-containing protein